MNAISRSDAPADWTGETTQRICVAHQRLEREIYDLRREFRDLKRWLIMAVLAVLSSVGVNVADLLGAIGQ